MKKDTLTIRKNRSSSGGGSFYAYNTFGEGGNYYHHREIAQEIKEREVVFDNLDQEEQDKLYLAILHTIETERQNHEALYRSMKGDVALLNRIIRADGMIEYIKKLEGMSV